jgi:hypothetical protein
MEAELEQRLLVSLQQDRLVLFFGAGLSMGGPSFLPGAATLAQQCAQTYRRKAMPVPLPAGADTDLENLTSFLFERGQQNFFLNDLMEWRPFTQNPNDGHVTIADFLCCNAIRCGITTNFDELVELAARRLGEPLLEAALDGVSVNTPRPYRPLLKMHGSVHDRNHTLWCKRQLRRNDPDPANRLLRSRIVLSRTWLQANLAERDLVFIGFWSDWAYLNRVFTSALVSIHPPLVVLVDPADAAYLKTKAPVLWKWANGNALNFSHAQQMGHDFLDELRVAFSRNFLDQALRSAVPSFQAMCRDPVPSTDFDGLESGALYSLRRDFCGVPGNTVARVRQPEAAMNAVSRAHLLLLSKGAMLEGYIYRKSDGKKIRIVNGLTRLLVEVQASFSSEAPPVAPYDYVICAGADNSGGVKPHILRGGPPATVVRRGAVAEWLTPEMATARGVL